jgi:hypothetical protein
MRGRLALDVRAKLLLLMGALTLPLLIVGLYQLHSYRSSVSDQAAAIARVEAEAASGALESWIENHPAQGAEPQALSQADARDLYSRIVRRTRPGVQEAIAVFDAEGRPVSLHPGAQAASPAKLPARDGQERWSDGVSRVTVVTRTSPSDWSVVVGVPPPEGSPAGHSIFLLAAAWGLTLGAYEPSEEPRLLRLDARRREPSGARAGRDGRRGRVARSQL